jgi:hypothetical protein
VVEHSTLDPQIKGSNPEKKALGKKLGELAFFVALPIALFKHSTRGGG